MEWSSRVSKRDYLLQDRSYPVRRWKKDTVVGGGGMPKGPEISSTQFMDRIEGKDPRFRGTNQKFAHVRSLDSSVNESTEGESE